MGILAELTEIESHTVTLDQFLPEKVSRSNWSPSELNSHIFESIKIETSQISITIFELVHPTLPDSNDKLVVVSDYLNTTLYLSMKEAISTRVSGLIDLTNIEGYLTIIYQECNKLLTIAMIPDLE